MAESDSTTKAPEKQSTSEIVPGPTTVKKVKSRLAILAAFAYLGKRAYMPDGDYTQEGWESFLESIDSPWTEEHLREIAFEALLKIASQAWTELFCPDDIVKGQIFNQAPAQGGEA